jgi:hypothetical protein
MPERIAFAVPGQEKGWPALRAKVEAAIAVEWQSLSSIYAKIFVAEAKAFKPLAGAGRTNLQAMLLTLEHEGVVELGEKGVRKWVSFLDRLALELKLPADKIDTAWKKTMVTMTDGQG